MSTYQGAEAQRQFGTACNYNCPPTCPCRQMAPRHYVHSPSMAEQMGVDPMSKLAAAIHDLADALRTKQD